MKFPTVFVNHGGGPLPILGRQPELVANMKEIRAKFLPKEPPKAIVVLSAHWESNPIKITASANPSMLFDYYGFPPEAYKFSYPAPGSPELAKKIKYLLEGNGLKSELDEKRGFDHGVFIPLMVMFPEANIPVVCVSMHSSLDAELNIKIGSSLASLREEDGVLIIGSGLTFHNMNAFFNPSEKTIKSSIEFNEWLKSTIMESNGGMLDKLQKWDSVPGARISHPREEHLLPLFMAAGAAGAGSVPQLVMDTTGASTFVPQAGLSKHAITGYIFQ